MTRTVLAVLFGTWLAVAACGQNDPAPVCTDAGGTKEFGARCSAACECASNFCFTFGDGTSTCTIECSADEECPVGSQGRKCNGQGVCRS